MMFSTFVSAALVFATLASVGSCINPTFPYGSKKVRGVNLGGWLVVEPWITPSLFDHTGNDKIVDEWTFCSMQDRSVAQAALQAHWDSWITETDLRDIAAAGLNHVRLPVGHWAWDVSAGEPYIQGQLPYVRKAVSWARKYGLKVIIDLHGAAGSQNAFDNSGVRSDAPLWHTDPWNIQRTNAVMKQIVAEFGPQVDVVSMIQPLNEPASFKDISMLPVVQQYYRDSYGNVRYPPNSAPSNTVLYIHDAFQNFSTGQWMNFMPSPQYAGVALDTHIYQVFSDEENARSGDEHVVSACKNGPDLAEFTANQLWTIVGEWAPAMTDCARYLNGRGVGARYDGTYPSSTAVGSCKGQSGDGSAFTKSHKRFLRKMWEAQVTAFEEGAGWLMWTWKTEEAADWSYQAGLAGGWIPRNPDDRIYPNICAH